MRIQPPLDFTLVILEKAFASSVSLTLDILSTAARLCARAGVSEPSWRVCSPSSSLVELGNGMVVNAQPLPSPQLTDASVWLVPGLGLADPDEVFSRISQPDALQASQAIARHAKRGGLIAASCSAVFLLHQAGVLAGRQVTVSWWLAPLLRTVNRQCNVQPQRMLIEDGNLITAGAAMAQADLVLYLLRRRYGVEMVDKVARVLLLDARDAQAPYVAHGLFSDGNELIARIIALVEEALPDVPKVTELAARLARSERTLARQVKAACGRSVQDVIQSVRLEKARRLLAGSRMSVDDIASQIGYRDATALRRLMLKYTGTTPSQFRPRQR